MRRIRPCEQRGLGRGQCTVRTGNEDLVGDDGQSRRSCGARGKSALRPRAALPAHVVVLQLRRPGDRETGDRETGSLIPTFRTLIGFKNTLLCFVGNSDQKRPFGQHNLREQWAGRAEFVGIPCNFP